MNKIININLLVLTTEFPPGPGGIGRHAYCLSSALADRHCQVTVLTESDNATPAELAAFDRAHEKSFRIVRTPRKGIATYFLRIANTLRLIAEIRPEVVIVSGKFSLWLGALVKLLKGSHIQVWAFLHGSELRLPRWAAQAATVFSLRRLDRLIAVSSFTQKLLPADLQQRAEILPNGLLLSSMPADHGRDIPPFDWPGWPRLLTVGSMTPRKGQHRVIKALPHLRRIWPDIRYHIVGMPHHQDALVALAETLGVSDNVVFHGRLSGDNLLWQAYRSADLFVMLSENQPDGDVEGFGIAILEANYFGMPAIGASGCGIEDAIHPGYNGFLVDGNDPAAIAQSIEQALSQKEALSANARHFAADHDWNKLVAVLFQGKIEDSAVMRVSG